MILSNADTKSVLSFVNEDKVHNEGWAVRSILVVPDSIRKGSLERQASKQIRMNNNILYLFVSRMKGKLTKSECSCSIYSRCRYVEKTSTCNCCYFASYSLLDSPKSICVQIKIYGCVKEFAPHAPYY